jgi:hypothetical protein
VYQEFLNATSNHHHWHSPSINSTIIKNYKQCAGRGPITQSPSSTSTMNRNIPTILRAIVHDQGWCGDKGHDLYPPGR